MTPGAPAPAFGPRSPAPAAPPLRVPARERGSAAAAASGGRRHPRGCAPTTQAGSRGCSAAQGTAPGPPRDPCGPPLPTPPSPHARERARRARVGGASHLLDVFPHLRAVITDHQQLQRVIHKSVLQGQGKPERQGPAIGGQGLAGELQHPLPPLWFNLVPCPLVPLG